MPTIAEVINLNKSKKGSNSVCDLVLLCNYDEKTENGTLIPSEKVEKITLVEDIFGRLPRLTIKFSDNGIVWFHGQNFEAGAKIYISMYPHSEDDGDVPKPYISGVFAIQSYLTMSDPASNTCIYTLECILEAYAYLNKVCYWPLDEGLPVQLEKTYSSSELVPLVAGQGGLKCSSEVSSIDTMTWVNTNLTCCDFIKKILSHAWIADDDAPIFYIDREGMAHYTSLRTLSKAPTKATYVDGIKYNKEQNADGTWNEYKRTYHDVMIDNRSYYSHETANTGISYVYNPWTPVDIPAPVIYSTEVVLKAPLKSATSYRYYTTEAGKRQPFFNGVSNITSGNIRYVSNDISFKQNHMWYDAAAIHNKNVVGSFFQYFAHMTVNMFTQVTNNPSDIKHASLGDRININFDSINYKDSVETGDFLVASIIHTIENMTSYTTMLTCVRDTVPAVVKRSS